MTTVSTALIGALAGKHGATVDLPKSFPFEMDGAFADLPSSVGGALSGLFFRAHNALSDLLSDTRLSDAHPGVPFTSPFALIFGSGNADEARRLCETAAAVDAAVEARGLGTLAVAAGTEEDSCGLSNTAGAIDAEDDT
jgi:hypothetical protein